MTPAHKREKDILVCDQDSSEDSTAILVATEASVACLYMLTSPDMPKQVYQEDIIEAIMDNAKFNLLSNVLSFNDARLCAAHRPQMASAPGQTPNHCDMHLLLTCTVVLLALHTLIPRMLL